MIILLYIPLYEECKMESKPPLYLIDSDVLRREATDLIISCVCYNRHRICEMVTEAVESPVRSTCFSLGCLDSKS
jgi:hypothetical protein